MGATSNESKQRWNASRYVQVKVSVEPELATAFKAKCESEGVSMASEISRFMSQKTGVSRSVRPVKDPYATRPQRRKAFQATLKEIEAFMDAEQGYVDNFPANLRNSERYDAAEHTVSVLEEGLSVLSEAY
jgi:hypothetical protein